VFDYKVNERTKERFRVVKDELDPLFLSVLSPVILVSVEGSVITASTNLLLFPFEFCNLRFSLYIFLIASPWKTCAFEARWLPSRLRRAR
jgi:hypothetical protein